MNVRYPQTRMGVESIMRDAFTSAIIYQNDWKKYNSLSSDEKSKTVAPRKDLEKETLSDILNSKTFVHCHSYVQSEILMLMRLAESFNFRIQTFTHILEGYKVATEMAKHGAMANTFADWWAYKFEVYDAMPYNATLMTNKGVVVGINSDDAEMSRRLNQEAAKSVMYGGMSQEEAWKMVTINPARQLKVDQYTGSVKIGKEADLVLWNANPLSNYAKVLQTYVDGKKYFDIESDKQMQKELKIEKANLIQKIIDGGSFIKKEESAIKKPRVYLHCDETEKNSYLGGF